jgi:hypothetical protein
MSISDELREHKQAIASRWEHEVLRDVPGLVALPRSSLVDHLPEFLDGLAAWIDGRTADAEAGFRALAEGHAMQRQSAGIELDALTAEYVTLRRVILEHLRERVPPEQLVEALVRLSAGLDQAIYEAARRYTAARDHVRERFIAILAHDLRDPLTTVMMSSTLLADLTLGEKQAQLVERLTRGARRIERMIDDMLDFARGRLDGGIPIYPALADMGEICSDAIDEARTLGPGREITADVAGDLRGHWDRDRVRQALGNLLANARRYGTGDIRVRVWEREDHHAVLTAIENTGPAIAAEAISRIFDPYARASDPSQRRGGLGLGLFIVAQIVRSHGGTYHVTSDEQLTTFTLEWPRTPLAEVSER